MHLIFIRHGDPDYVHNTVTEKGKREVECLTPRVCSWKVEDFFVSPYGRAKDTIEPALEKLGREAETLDWLREFDVRVTDPVTKKPKCPWDWLPVYYYAHGEMFDKNKWINSKVYNNKEIIQRYKAVCDGFDEVLERYDYTRKSKNEAIYNCFPHITQEEALTDTHLLAFQKDTDEKNLVFVCHLGVMFVIISHLTGLSPVQLWQGFFVAPTSVTVLSTEERVPGEAVFRVQQLGDVSHLIKNGENPSCSGFFGNVGVF